jgi:hypothetical protein
VQRRTPRTPSWLCWQGNQALAVQTPPRCAARAQALLHWTGG